MAGTGKESFESIRRKLNRALAKLTDKQRNRVEQLLAGRVSEDRRKPMRITDTIRLETVELVLRESQLAGACCAACRAANLRKEPQPRNEAIEVINPLDGWEGRKLSADELRLRLARLRESSPVSIAAEM